MSEETHASSKTAQSPGSAAKPEESVHVIMLDYLMAQFPEEWPLSGEDQDLDRLRGQTTHDGNAKRVSRQLYTMSDRLEQKTLKNVRTGRIDAGGIYEAREKTS